MKKNKIQELKCLFGHHTWELYRTYPDIKTFYCKYCNRFKLGDDIFEYVGENRDNKT